MYTFTEPKHHCRLIAFCIVNFLINIREKKTTWFDCFSIHHEYSATESEKRLEAIQSVQGVNDGRYPWVRTFSPQCRVDRVRKRDDRV